MSLHSSFKIELKRFIKISIITVLLIIFQFWLWSFVASSANTLQEKRTQEDQLYNLQRRIMEVESTFDNQQSLLDQLEVIFPGRGSTSQAVERLESMAEQKRVSLVIRSITETEKQQLVELEVAITATGTAAALLQFMDSVEHVSELTKIQRWSLEGAKNTQNEEGVATIPQYDLVMQVIFYMQAN